jgi:hypothetical protein
MSHRFHPNMRGTIVLQVLLFVSIGIVMLSGIVSWGVANVKAARLAEYRERAIQIAESGIDYYRWHLAHATTDFQDGRATTGPYVHEFTDKNGNVLGSFTLNIIPPPFGTTIVTIRSTGTTSSTPPVSRTIEARLAIPSLARFAVVANANMRFGVGTEIFGPIHSNGGIRFDGLAHNVVSSSMASYDDPDHSGGNEFGVHTHVNAPPGSGTNDTFRPQEAPPTNPVPSRPDVFEIGRQFPLPAVDFAGLTADLAAIRASTQTTGYYYGPSGGQGYYIRLSPNDTYSVYRVNTLVNPSCSDPGGQSGWGSWSIATTTPGALTLIDSNRAFPSDGMIFFEDHLWVDGKINTARLTIAAAKFPDNVATRKSITIDYNLEYTNYDGQDVIALIAQNNVNVGLMSSDVLRIDAALVAQNGRIGRYFYSSACAPYGPTRPMYRRNTITLYGMLATHERYGFSYTGSAFTCSDGTQRGSGYCYRDITYDTNLLYGPPPSFPLTGSQYEVLSWQEVANP